MRLALISPYASRKWLALLPLCMLLLASGCATVRTEEKPVSETTLIVTRAGEETTLSWASQAGATYAVMFADSRDSRTRWQPLPGAERLKGNGSNLVVHDRVPTGRTRYYRLQLLSVPAP